MQFFFGASEMLNLTFREKAQIRKIVHFFQPQKQPDDADQALALTTATQHSSPPWRHSLLQ